MGDRFPLRPLVFLVLWASPGWLILGRIVKEVGRGFLQQFLPSLTPSPPSAQSLWHSCVSKVIWFPPSGDLFFFFWVRVGIHLNGTDENVQDSSVPQRLNTQIQESGTPEFYLIALWLILWLHSPLILVFFISKRRTKRISTMLIHGKSNTGKVLSIVPVT